MTGGNIRRISTLLVARDEASDKLRDVESAGDDTAEGLEGAEQSAVSLRAGLAALAGASTVLTGSLAMLVRQHGPTEQLFAEMGEVAAETDEELEAMQETAVGLGATMPVSIRESADAMRQLAFAGFEAEEAIAAAQGVAELAVASSLDVGQAARVSSSSLRMFGMEADEIDRVTASMASTFSEASLTIQELSQAIERAGATASMLGAEIEEVSGILGVMANQGIRAERAGTAIDSMLVQLVNQSGRAEDAMADLGLELEDFVDESGELVDMDIMITQIAGSLDDMDNRLEQVRVATQLFGQRGSRAILSLADDVDDVGQLIEQQYLSQIDSAISRSEQFEEPIEVIEMLAESTDDTAEMAAFLERELELSSESAALFAGQVRDSSIGAEELAEEIENATTATDLMEAQLDTTAGSIDFLRSSIDAFTHQLFVSAGPTIQFTARRVATLTNFLNENEEVANAGGKALLALAAASSAATLAIGGQIVATKAAAAASGTFVGAMLAKGAAALVAAGGVGALTVAGAPLWAIILALIGAVGGLAYIMRTDFLGAGDEVAWMFDTLGRGASWLGGELFDVGRNVYELIRLLMTLGKVSTLAPIAGFLRLIGVVRDTRETFRAFGRDLPGIIAEGIRNNSDAPVEAVEEIAQDIRDRFPFSPARAGPLTDVDQVGPGLMSTVASSIDGESGPVVRSLEGALGEVSIERLFGGMGGNAVGTGGGSGAGGGQGDYYHFEVKQEIHIGDSNATESGVADASRRGVSEFERFMERLGRDI